MDTRLPPRPTCRRRTAFFEVLTGLVHPALPALALTALALTGCVGRLEGTATPGTPGAPSDPPPTPTEPGGHDAPPTRDLGAQPLSVAEACAAPSLGSTELRRLTRTEYGYAISDLLGVSSSLAATMVDDERSDGQREGLTRGFFVGPEVSLTLATQYLDVATDAATEAAPRLAAECARADASCAAELATRLGRRALRRPLEAAERDELVALYEAGRAIGDHETGIQLLLEGLLSAPELVYHLEGLEQDPGAVVQLDGFEVAARLSFLLWRSIPDDALLDAAEAGELDASAGITAQARRLMADERFDRAIQDFHRQWSRTERLATLTRNAELFPEFTPELRDSMVRSLEAYLRDAVRSGTFEGLLTSNEMYVDQHLGPIVGVASSSEELERVEIDGTERAGILGQPGLMAALAYGNQTDPVHRGVFVAQRIVCRDLEAPPFAFSLPEPTAEVSGTLREQFEALHLREGCASCHGIIDPLGFGLDDLDPLGRHRTHERGHALDVSGTLPSEVGLEHRDFSGAAGLAYKLADSEVVTECYARQWSRFALRRQEAAGDACTVALGYEALRDGSIADMIVALVTSPSFVQRRLPAAP
jgi:hypothetical protein